MPGKLPHISPTEKVLPIAPGLDFRGFILYSYIAMRLSVQVLKALADRNRVRIVKLLQHKAMCVCELTAVLGISQPSVSRHLRVLRDAGLVSDEKKGVWIDYRLADEGDNPLGEALLRLLAENLEDDRRVVEDRAAADLADRIKILGHRKEGS